MARKTTRTKEGDWGWPFGKKKKKRKGGSRKWWVHECKHCIGRGTVKRTHTSKSPRCPKCGRRMTTYMDSSML